MIEDKCLLSIVVPVYNVEKYIEQCLTTVVLECSDQVELIIVNDGTQDKSMETVEDLVRELTNVVIINQANKGLSAARNKGLEIATGQYVFFVDSDDGLKNGTISFLVNYLEQNNGTQDVITFAYDRVTDIDMAAFRENYEIYVQDPKVEGITVDNLLDLIENPLSCAWRYIVKRDFLLQKKIVFREGKLCEDIEWCTQVLINAKSINYIKDGLYYYRVQRVDSIMSVVSGKRVNDALEGILNSYKRINEIKDHPNLKKILRKALRRQLLYNWSFLVDLNDDKALEEAIKKIYLIIELAYTRPSKLLHQHLYFYVAKILRWYRLK